MEIVFLDLHILDDYQSPQMYRQWSVKLEKNPKQINHCLSVTVDFGSRSSALVIE